MKAKHIIRHSVVKFEKNIYMLENKPRHPVLISQDGKMGIEIKQDTELEVVKYPAQLAMDYMGQKG